MSIEVQAKIRSTCLYRGGQFAVLMAMADCANTKDGRGIFPGSDLLAANARVKVRQTQNVVKQLRGDLVVILVGPNGEDLGPQITPRGGRGHKTEYRIDLVRLQEMQGLHEKEASGCPSCEVRRKRALWREQRDCINDAVPRAKGATPEDKGANNDVKGAIPYTRIRTHEPSVEPSRERMAAAPPVGGAGPRDLLGAIFQHPPTPSQFQDLAFDAYDQAAERLGWQVCKSRNDTRRKKLAQRVEEAGGLKGWLAALEKAEASDFCMGRAPPQPGRPPFKLDVDFLLQQSSFVKLMEGRYDNRETGPGPRGGGSFLEAAARIAARDAASCTYRDEDA